MARARRVGSHWPAVQLGPGGRVRSAQENQRQLQTTHSQRLPRDAVSEARVFTKPTDCLPRDRSSRALG